MAPQSSKSTFPNSSLHSAQATLLLIPGWNGSGPGHWQELWERKYPNSLRLHQRDWRHPRLTDWLDQLEHAIEKAGSPLILVAHSLGCILVAHWAFHSARVSRIRAALLIAPAWFADARSCPAELKNFYPAPITRLPFPSWLVGSENDPYTSGRTARRVAETWGSTYLSVGTAGHINVNSGHGDWPEGERILSHAIERSAAAQPRGKSVNLG